VGGIRRDAPPVFGRRVEGPERLVDLFASRSSSLREKLNGLVPPGSNGATDVSYETVCVTGKTGV